MLAGRSGGAERFEDHSIRFLSACDINSQRSVAVVGSVASGAMLAGVTIAVTGGGGYLGTALVRKLVSSTSVHSVVAIDVAEPRAHVVDQRVSYVSADVRDAEQLRVVLEEFQVTLVFHCCAVIDLCPVRKPLSNAIFCNYCRYASVSCFTAGDFEVVQTLEPAQERAGEAIKPLSKSANR